MKSEGCIYVPEFLSYVTVWMSTTDSCYPSLFWHLDSPESIVISHPFGYLS